MFRGIIEICGECRFVGCIVHISFKKELEEITPNINNKSPSNSLKRRYFKSSTHSFSFEAKEVSISRKRKQV